MILSVLLYNKTSLFNRRIIHFLCKCLSTNLLMAQKGQALTMATLPCCAQLQRLVYLQESVALQAHQTQEKEKVMTKLTSKKKVKLSVSEMLLIIHLWTPMKASLHAQQMRWVSLNKMKSFKLQAYILVHNCQNESTLTARCLLL